MKVNELLLCYVVIVVAESLRSLLRLVSSVKSYRISTQFIWMMQGFVQYIL